MTSTFDRGLENANIDSYIEVTETDVGIPLDSTWIPILSTNNKIGIRRRAVEIDPEACYPFNLQAYYSSKHDPRIKSIISRLT
jgi:hypothetical protein